jgi:thiamine-phosphate pyrophosphorylase
MVIANAKRVEESLRVMEELARLPELGSKLDSTVFAQARFSLYTLERDLVSRVSRSAKSKRICGLYVILDRQFLSGRDEMDVARQVIAGGAKVIQLRDKEGNRRHLLSAGKRLKELCAQNGVLFIINDYLDLAIALDADGIHVGQEDLPLPTVRKQLPIDKLIGCSVNTVPQALKAQEEGADYIAVGSIFPTETKKAATVVGVDIIRELKQKVSVPVVAIGGINSSNIGDVIAAGADAVAVISGILSQEDVLHATEALVAKMSSGDKGD